jgi:hypothetical protein
MTFSPAHNTVARTRVPRLLLALSVLVGVVVVVPATSARAASYPALIAFDDRDGGPGTTAVFMARPGHAGSDHRQIAGASDPAWSPAGDRLAFLVSASTFPNKTSLMIGDRLGKNAHKLISGPGRALNDTTSVNGPLAWSPNGREIAYQCDEASPDGSIVLAQLCTVDVASGTRHMITEPATFPGLQNDLQELQRLSWSPDGTEVIGTVFQHVTCADPPTGPFQQPWCGYPSIAAIHVSTGATQVLTDAHTRAVTAEFAPNGRHIAYYDVSIGVRVMDADGGGARTVVKNATLFGGALADEPYPAYSPDGRELLFTKYATGDAPGTGYAQLYTIDADGSGPLTQLTHSAFDAFRAVWTAIRTTCTVPALSGKTIAQAKTALKQAACSLGTVTGPHTNRAHRHITKQSLKPNTERPAGTKINVVIK